VDSKFKLLNFPEPKEKEPEDTHTMYEVTIAFSTGKNLTVFCTGFTAMEHLGSNMIGFSSGIAETSVDTIVNCSKIDYMDIDEVEI
tara:strand:- start:466 stop:723 length:258 start_codon:yes stop_codon:yes gene_type:complete